MTPVLFLGMEVGGWQYVGILGSGWFLATVIALRTITALIRGELVPRKTLMDWKAAAEIKDEQLADQAKQLAALTEVGPTVHQTMKALQDLAGRTQEDETR